MVEDIAKGLALAFLAGRWSEDELYARGRLTLGGGARGRVLWLQKLVRRVVAAFPTAPIDRDDELAALLAGDRGLRDAMYHPSDGPRIHIHRWLIPDATMVPVTGALSRFPVLPIPSPADLAGSLGLRDAELAWFVDERRMDASAAGPKLAD